MLIMSTRAICFGGAGVDGHLIAVESRGGRTNERVELDGLPSMRTGSNAWMPSRWSVGARFKENRVLADALFQDLEDLRGSFSTIFFADDGDVAAALRLVVMNGEGSSLSYRRTAMKLQ